MKKEWKEKKRTLGSFGDLIRRTWEAVGTPKLGMGAKGRLETALKPPPYLITDNSVMGMDSGTNGHVWDREEKSLDETELKWLQLPLSPFCLSLSFSSSASASALWWTFSKFQDRMDRDACFISPSSCCYPFHFLVLVSDWQVKALSSQMAAHPSLCWLHNLKREINNRERGRVLKAVIFKEAVTLKKRINQN